jgi:uncharacterized protein (TIGR03437 family)
VVSILGANLGPPLGAAEYDSGGLYPTGFGNTTVTFNGIAAPLLSVSPGRINAVAPAMLASVQAAEVVVSRGSEASVGFTVPVTEVSPAIFTSTPEGATQGAPLNYQFPEYSPNSAGNPAAPGSVVVLFATGAGVWADSEDASIGLFALPFTARPVTLSIGGQPARVFYIGVAPYQTNGDVADQCVRAGGNRIGATGGGVEYWRSGQRGTAGNDRDQVGDLDAALVRG